MKKALFLVLVASFGLQGQGVINNLLQHSHGAPSAEAEAKPQCGSHILMMEQDRRQPGFKAAADAALKEAVSKLERRNKSLAATLTVPVVFHVVYNDSTENLPDSVIYNQLASLNANFSRQNPDTINLRTDFEPYVGNPKIKFELATVDPAGNPTNGIVRQPTSIEHFGGILPYGANQPAQIQQWVNDSLFYNFSRLTFDSLGGSDAWDVERYLNIWIGDLRIFEPQFNNFEELVFLGFARPPSNHPNFVGTGIDTLLSTTGAIMHYVAIGPNNPNQYPAPYAGFNSVSTEGDLLSHEVGHYLALRHIWGDGNCSADDYISDTPLSNNSNQFTCNTSRNTCVDSIGGANLPDMIENFMDYSTDACMNAFTHEQALLMRSTLFNYRPNLFTISTSEQALLQQIECFPNPSNGALRIQAPADLEAATVKVYNLAGVQLQQHSLKPDGSLELELAGPNGLYLVQVSTTQGERTFKVVKR